MAREFQRLVEFSPAYDHGREGGCHGVELRMVLKGPEGAVQFLLFTNWMLPETREKWGPLPSDHPCVRPMPVDLGYHSPKPMYEGQEPMRHIYKFPKFPTNFETWEGGEPGVYGDPVICPYLDGDVPCYYDGSGLNAEPVFERLLREGSDGVWAVLEEYYEQVFLTENNP
jgi:hypothetical protein